MLIVSKETRTNIKKKKKKEKKDIIEDDQGQQSEQEDQDPDVDQLKGSEGIARKVTDQPRSTKKMEKKR